MEKMESVDNPLHEAAKRGNLAYVQECIRNGVSVNALDKVCRCRAGRRAMCGSRARRRCTGRRGPDTPTAWRSS